MNHLEIHILLDKTFGPLNPIVVEIKEALKLPEEFQELLEAIWIGDVDYWHMVPIEIFIKLLEKEPNLSKSELKIKFHGLTYLTCARIINNYPNEDFYFSFEASSGPPVLSNPLRGKIFLSQF